MNFVTGATGLLGSHIAEQLVQRGETVRALVRPTSDTRFLQSLGIELCQGDLGDTSPLRDLRRAMAKAEVVYHCAAKVGDWGPWAEHQRDTIDATRNVLHACADVGVRRLVYISSISAYGHPEPQPQPITEEEPLGTRFWVWDNYTRAKVEAERLLWDVHEKRRLPVTVIRPGWIYGPRDRTSIFRLARSLRLGRVRIIGKGDNRLNTVYAANVAHACLLAASNPDAVGQAYNVSNDGCITQQEYMNLVADALGLPRPRSHVPYVLAYSGAFAAEAVFRLLRLRQPPFVTRYATWLLGRSTFYSTEKAQRRLGWEPRVSYPEGIHRTAEWYQAVVRSP